MLTFQQDTQQKAKFNHYLLHCNGFHHNTATLHHATSSQPDKKKKERKKFKTPPLKLVGGVRVSGSVRLLQISTAA